MIRVNTRSWIRADCVRVFARLFQRDAFVARAARPVEFV
jgi:hypothetical protein